MHVLIDSCIYRADRKRNKPAFRAIIRLAKAGRLQLHVPYFVKGEILTQEQQDTREEIGKIKGAATTLVRISNEPTLHQHAERLVTTANEMAERGGDRIAAALEEWIAEASDRASRRAGPRRTRGRGVLRWQDALSRQQASR